MGRRSIHTQDQLRKLILVAARKIIEQDGLIGFSAREIARRVDYSPGTIYNIFDSLDELLLEVQAELLGEIVARLKAVEFGPDGHDNISRLSTAYVNFAIEHSRLWNLLVGHQMSEPTPIPQAIQENLNAIAMIVGNGLRPLIPKATDETISQTAQALWTGVHGITAVAVTEKGMNITPRSADKYVKLLTSTFTRGLTGT